MRDKVEGCEMVQTVETVSMFADIADPAPAITGLFDDTAELAIAPAPVKAPRTVKAGKANQALETGLFPVPLPGLAVEGGLF